MLKYLIIQLAEDSVSFCHYQTKPNSDEDSKLIPLDTLKEAVIWAMKENLMVQFLYPDYELAQEYKEIINEIDHVNIVSAKCEDNELLDHADITVFNSVTETKDFPFKETGVYVVRGTYNDFITGENLLAEILPKVARLNLVITDIPSLTPDIETKYIEFLDRFSYKIRDEYGKNHFVQVNILTDRIMLDEMNNCNAGVEHLTLAPDGNFYICPAFYVNGIESGECGTLQSGVKIKNDNLYKISYAPICRECDAYQCNRCIWLNQSLTLEVNTPGMQQCVTSHLERNASKALLSKIRELGEFMPEKKILEIDYLDPFDKIMSNK